MLVQQMRLIQNNPYRTVGLLVGATAREQERQVKRLKHFIEADQNPEKDWSFPILGQLDRTIDTVNDAASKLNLDNDKLNAALYWFYKGNPITDEPAIEAMQEADIAQALSIWTKLTSNNEVSQRNASAFSNLGTLYLSGILDASSSNQAFLEKGIWLKLKFLQSDFVKDFKALATDETFKTTKKEIQLSFLNQLQTEIEKSGLIPLSRFITILSKQEFAAKDDFLNTFAKNPIQTIEKQVAEAKAKRKANKANAYIIGKTLYEQTGENLRLCKSILGPQTMQLTSISDLISDEILSCGIDYFLHYKDTNTDPSGDSMSLFRLAKSIAIGSIVNHRCQENTEQLKQWIDDKPERDRQKRIADDLQFITSKLERFQDLSDTVANAKDLVDSCKPRLVNIKNALGANDDFYLKVSSAVVSNAQGMLVTAVNEAQDGFAKFQSLGRLGLDYPIPSFKTGVTSLFVSLSEIQIIVDAAYDVTTSMQSMDMDSGLKQAFQKNRDTLRSIRDQINSVARRTGTSSTQSSRATTGSRTVSSTPKSSSSNSGCYIATMAYGDYDHPQVIILRQFRDEVLDQSPAGKWFIRTYYRLSPKLVARLKNKKSINIIIRKTLNQFIKLIK